MKKPGGVIVPLVTPLSRPDRLDEPALRRLVKHVAGGGVNGLFPLGTTGEFPYLSESIRRRVLEITIEEAGGRLPVFAGIADTNFNRVLKNAATAKDAGAAGAVLLPPYYFPLEDDELIAFYSRVADESGLPIIMYDNPPFTGASIPEKATAALAKRAGVVGIKDSRGDMAGLKRLISAHGKSRGFSVLVGDESLAADALLRGAAGMVAGTANLAPSLCADLYAAAAAADRKKCAAIDSAFTRLRGIYKHGASPWSAYIKGLKAALSIIGICSPLMTEPFQPLSRAAMEEITRELAEFGLL